MLLASEFESLESLPIDHRRGKHASWALIQLSAFANVKNAIVRGFSIVASWQQTFDIDAL
jgi:hypothetical protein